MASDDEYYLRSKKDKYFQWRLADSWSNILQTVIDQAIDQWRFRKARDIREGQDTALQLTTAFYWRTTWHRLQSK